VGRALVILNSEGGALYAGLNIGITILNKRFNTYAPEICASVCGMIWLAGYTRYVTEKSNNRISWCLQLGNPANYQRRQCRGRGLSASTRVQLSGNLSTYSGVG
jgi:hypothetical protein